MPEKKLKLTDCKTFVCHAEAHTLQENRKTSSRSTSVSKTVLQLIRGFVTDEIKGH